MKILIPIVALALTAVAAEPLVIPLYPGAAPGSESWNWPETAQPSTDTIRRLANVSKPTLTVYRPEPGKANGTAVVVCPGGGFRILAINHEGEEVATWLNSFGVTAIVLKYRVMRTGDGGDKDPQELAKRRAEAIGMGVADGLAAMKVVRSHAGEWGIAKDRIGILGFSAGGWVTVGVALQGTGDSRPDFAAPIYPAVPNELEPPANAPPLFIVHADDDKTVPPAKHSIRLYEAWKKIGVPVEMHIYTRGGHGFGMRRKSLPVDGWTARLQEWMASQKLLRP